MSTTQPGPGVAAAAATTVLLLNTLWHGSATYYFSMKARGMLRKYMHPRLWQTTAKGQVVPEAAIHMSRYLGGINSAFTFLALYNLIRYLVAKKVSLGAVWALALANFSQFVYDIVVHYQDAAKWEIIQLTIPDGLMAVFNVLLALHIIQATKPVKVVVKK